MMMVKGRIIISVRGFDGSRLGTACNARNSHISDFCTVQSLYCVFAKQEESLKYSLKNKKGYFKKS